MILSLFLISAVMSGALAFVYQLTLEPIRMAEANKTNNAISQVVPEFDNNPGSELYYIKINDGKDSLAAYPAKKNGELKATAVITHTNIAFSGSFTVMVGLLPDGTINNTFVLTHKETPGLGSKMSDAKFHDQFNGKNPSAFKLAVRKDGGEVDAISAATISSRAYCDALNRAYKAYTQTWTDGNSGATNKKDNEHN